MANENEEIFSMNQIMDDVDASMKKIHEGDLLKGRVISVTDNKVLVNIGYISDGIIEREEICDNPETSPRDLVKAEDEIFVVVLSTNDEGTVLLSKKKADGMKIWDDFEDSMKNGTPMEVKISEAVNGGAVAIVSGVRVFIPASQLSVNYVENIGVYVNKTVTGRVIDLDRDKSRVVLSVKELEKKANDKKRAELLKTVKKGDILSGKVSRLAKFGAFVDLGGMDGLIHISELSWKRVNDPAEVVSVGDEVEVYVLGVDVVKGNISLGLRKVSENPWNTIAQQYLVDHIYDGKVTRLTDFGAFVEIGSGSGIEGLVHISQISDEHVTKVSSVLKVGDAVRVKVLDIKEKEQKISLSIKDAVESLEGDASDYSSSELNTSLGDLLRGKLSGMKFD